MRTRTLLMMDSTYVSYSTVADEAEEAASPVVSSAQQQRSPWQSPVPYMFGGLAAMLGLIAFALLILACSYWRMSGGRDEGRESAPKESSLDVQKPARVLEQKVVVIMAGEHMPTYIATPVYAKNVYCDDAAKRAGAADVDVVGENARKGGGCDDEDKKDALHSHVVDIEGGAVRDAHGR